MTGGNVTRKLITAIVPLWIFTAFALMRFNEDIALIMLSIPMFVCLYVLSEYAFAAPIGYIAEKLERRQRD